MKKKLAIFGLLLTAAFQTHAVEPSISQIVARQRWPWNDEVDISFLVSGTNTDVKIVAQYDGVEPFTLAEKDLDGEFLGLAPGLHHISWSPSRAGLSAATLKNFRILSVEPDDTDRTYLVLNLFDGSYRYMSAPPAGGWLSDPAYYQTNMVFRRIPAGTSVLGLPDDLLNKVGATTAYYARPYTATVSSDYYLGVYPVMIGQHNYAMARVDGSVIDVSDSGATIPSSAGSSYPYNSIRGSVADGINWPTTQYEVSDGSYMAKYRTITRDTLPRGWIVDLPTAVQWERAARATTPTNWLFSVGGTVDDSMETITNLVNQIATTKWHKGAGGTVVGQWAPNGWGLYDMVGLCFQWNIDWRTGDTSYYSGVDPVGPETGAHRMRRSYSVSASGASIANCTTAYNSTGNVTSGYHYRLCIHVKNIFKK